MIFYSPIKNMEEFSWKASKTGKGQYKKKPKS
jgi:hypothetical protein